MAAARVDWTKARARSSVCKRNEPFVLDGAEAAENDPNRSLGSS